VVNRIVATDSLLGSDLDEDGINDEWEQLIVDFDGNDSVDGINDVTMTSDFDNDGALDIDEFQNGTDPRIQDQFIVTIKILDQGMLGNDFFIDVDGGTTGRKVTSSDDLILPFTDVSGVTAVNDDNGMPNRFIIPANQINSMRDFFRIEEVHIAE